MGINIYSSGTFFIQLSELAQRHEETELTLKNEIQLLSMGSSEKAEKIENLVKELNVLTGKLSQVKLCDTGWLHFLRLDVCYEAQWICAFPVIVKAQDWPKACGQVFDILN